MNLETAINTLRELKDENSYIYRESWEDYESCSASLNLYDLSADDWSIHIYVPPTEEEKEEIKEKHRLQYEDDKILHEDRIRVVMPESCGTLMRTYK
jgi:hypothetical protein